MGDREATRSVVGVERLVVGEEEAKVSTGEAVTTEEVGEGLGEVGMLSVGEEGVGRCSVEEV
jgi:hypothetical protein